MATTDPELVEIELPPEVRQALRKALLAYMEEISERAWAAGHMSGLESSIWNLMQDYDYTGTCQSYGMEDMVGYMPQLWALARLSGWQGGELDDDGVEYRD